MPAWAPFSVYTMLHSERLAEQYARGGRHYLREGKRWVTGQRLWAEARRQGLQTPVIFSAAEADKGLIYWGLIEEIDLDDAGTTCAYSQLGPIVPAKRISILRLRSTGRPMSDANIRPYAICHTPGFVL
jgi:hypothetical protein